MEKKFRKYNKLNASLFDLIEGDSEVQQTISLAYLLYHDSEFLEKFMGIRSIKKLIENVFKRTFKIQNYSKIIVSSELSTKNDDNNNERVDITIQFYGKNNIPNFVLFIEAKNAKSDISPIDAISQLERYLGNEDFEMPNFTKFGCTLTKRSFVKNANNLCSITWSDLIDILESSTGLAKDYLNFLTNIGGTMKFYEEEVCSIPAGKTYQYIIGEPYIYECPEKYATKKTPLYFGFRKSDGGEMEKLFGLEEIIILNPKRDFNFFQRDDSYSDEVKARIKSYCDRSWGEGNYQDQEKRFFVLSKNNQIDLPNNPKPPSNNSFTAYYSLADVLNNTDLPKKS